MQLSTILNAIADISGYSVADIEGKSRKRELVAARQLYCYMCKKHTKNSLSSIGATIGDRDHTTILHSVTTIKGYIETQDQLISMYLKIIRMRYPYLIDDGVQVKKYTGEICNRPIYEVYAWGGL